jgi:replicative DNA helicase
LADLRESGAIEQDADVVMFIYSEDEQDDLVEEHQRNMKLYIAKHRAGATGEIDLLFRGDRVKFYDVDDSRGL